MVAMCWACLDFFPNPVCPLNGDFILDSKFVLYHLFHYELSVFPCLSGLFIIVSEMPNILMLLRLD